MVALFGFLYESKWIWTLKHYNKNEYTEILLFSNSSLETSDNTNLVLVSYCFDSSILLFLVEELQFLLIFIFPIILMLSYICCKVISNFHIYQIFEYKLLLFPHPRLLSFLQVLFSFLFPTQDHPMEGCRTPLNPL